MASGASIKPGRARPGAPREPLDGVDVPCPCAGPMPVARSAATPSTAGMVASDAGSSPANPASAPPQAARCWGRVARRDQARRGCAAAPGPMSGHDPPRGPRCRRGEERHRDQRPAIGREASRWAPARKRPPGVVRPRPPSQRVTPPSLARAAPGSPRPAAAPLSPIIFTSGPALAPLYYPLSGPTRLTGRSALTPP
jgi:hypothetical protein